MSTQDFWFHLYRPTLGDVIVDIGAGRGEDVIEFSRAVGPSGRVIAVEPHPVSFRLLKKFCQSHRLSNVSLFQVACVEASSDLQIETLPVWQSNFTFGRKATSTSHPVRGVTFDSICELNGIGRIDFLKMNIEGAERQALPGCNLAMKRARYASIAAHDFRADRGEGEQFRTLSFVRGFMAEAGFEVVTRDTDPRYYVPYHVHGKRTTYDPS